ncbi:hypothetical protein Bca4012_052076 [Brassica carinata]
MFCGRIPGLLLATMKALDNLGLDVQQAVISCFNGFALDVFRSEHVLFYLLYQWDKNLFVRFLVVLDKHLIVSLSVLDNMDKSYVCHECYVCYFVCAVRMCVFFFHMRS